ncbi:MAG: hypothetical protein HWE39_18325 [Oceanospirillaceae bacterium]|nr:hypothetical protein [Oceanospirillaceae bacterium]
MKLIKLISLLLIFSNSTYAYAQECLETGVWDWYSDDFKDFDGRYMDKPWFSDSHIGISMTNNPMCYENGWRLMTRKFKCSDFYTTEECLGAIARPGSYKPRFALYNIHTGVVRFFLYVDSGVPQTQRVQLSFSMDQGSNSHDYGIFLNDNDESTIYEEKSTETNTGKIMIFPSYGLSENAPKWLIFDKYLSYEPNKHPDSGLQFNIYIDGIEESALNMEGNFEFKIEEVQSTKEKSVVETLLDSADDIMKSYSSVSELSSDLKTKGNAMIDKELKDSGYDPNDGPPNLATKRYELGLNLLGVAQSVGSVSGPIGYVAAAATLIKAFDNSPSSPKISFGDGEINLKGSIFSQYAINHRAIGVPYSKHIEEANESELEKDGYNNALGLFHFTKKPEIAVYYQAYYHHENGSKIDGLVGVLLSEIRPTILINPNSDMVLDEIKIMPYLEVNTKEKMPRSGLISSKPYQNYLGYGQTKELSPLTFQNISIAQVESVFYKAREKYSSHIGIHPNISMKGENIEIGHAAYSDNLNIITGDKFLSEDIAKFWTIGAFGTYHSEYTYDKYYVKDVKVKIYLKFKHKNKEDIFAEFVKILDVEEYTCDSIAEKYILNSQGRKSSDVCNSNIDTDNDGIKDYLESEYRMDPYNPEDAYSDIDSDDIPTAEEINNHTNPYIAEPKTGCSLEKFKDGTGIIIVNANGMKNEWTLKKSNPDRLNEGESILAPSYNEIRNSNGNVFIKCSGNSLYGGLDNPWAAHTFLPQCTYIDSEKRIFETRFSPDGSCNQN